MTNLPTTDNYDALCSICNRKLWKGFDFRSIKFNDTEVEIPFCPRCIQELRFFLVAERRKHFPKDY